MTKADIIAKTLKECRCPLDIGEPLTGDEPDYEEIVIAELSRRLPDTDIKTCEDFRHLIAVDPKTGERNVVVDHFFGP